MQVECNALEKRMDQRASGNDIFIELLWSDGITISFLKFLKPQKNII